MARVLSICLLASAAVVGCSTRTGALDDYSRYEVIRPELEPEVAHLLMSEFGITAEGLIQSRVPQIVEAQTDPVVIENVDIFGAGFMAGIRRSAWRLQPIGSAFDSAIFLEQVRRFLETEAAKTALGPATPAIKDLWAAVNEEFRRSMNEILREPDHYGPTVAESADALQITDLTLVRSSPMPAVADDATNSITDALTAVNNADFTLGAIYTRVNSIVASIPEDIRRQVDRSVRSLMRESLVVNALIGLSRLGEGMKETGAAAAAIDQRLGRMQDIILVEVDRQRRDTISALQGERESLVEAISAERQAFIDGLSLERQAIMAEVRTLVLGEDSGVLAEVRRTTDTAVDRAISGIQNTIMLALIGILVIVVLVVAFSTGRRSN